MLSIGDMSSISFCCHSCSRCFSCLSADSGHWKERGCNYADNSHVILPIYFTLFTTYSLGLAFLGAAAPRVNSATGASEDRRSRSHKSLLGKRSMKAHSRLIRLTIYQGGIGGDNECTAGRKRIAPG